MIQYTKNFFNKRDSKSDDPSTWTEFRIGKRPKYKIGYLFGGITKFTLPGYEPYDRVELYFLKSEEKAKLRYDILKKHKTLKNPIFKKCSYDEAVVIHDRLQDDLRRKEIYRDRTVGDNSKKCPCVYWLFMSDGITYYHLDWMETLASLKRDGHDIRDTFEDDQSFKLLEYKELQLTEREYNELCYQLHTRYKEY